MPASLPFSAIILDVDGTLYRPGPVRRAMARRLVRALVTRPLRTRTTLAVIRAYRDSLEVLRGVPGLDHPSEQLRRTVERTGLPEAAIRALIERWMFELPLGAIAAAARPGLARFLELAGQRGVRIGAFSEYPCEAKLERLGIRHRFAAVVSSHDPAVRRFKPDPSGFLHTASLLGSPSATTLVIGDRDDADGAGARAAGMRFIEIGGPGCPSFEPLCGRLFRRWPPDQGLC